MAWEREKETCLENHVKKCSKEVIYFSLMFIIRTLLTLVPFTTLLYVSQQPATGWEVLPHLPRSSWRYKVPSFLDSLSA